MLECVLFLLRGVDLLVKIPNLLVFSFTFLQEDVLYARIRTTGVVEIQFR